MYPPGGRHAGSGGLARSDGADDFTDADFAQSDWWARTALIVPIRVSNNISYSKDIRIRADRLRKIQVHMVT